MLHLREVDGLRFTVDGPEGKWTVRTVNRKPSTVHGRSAFRFSLPTVNRKPSTVNRAFTLVEALVCVALISGGIAICMTTLSAIGRAQVRVTDRETMQRLAIHKYDELLILGTLTTGESSGDFADLGQQRFQWRADRSPSSVGNLDVLRVDVAPKGESYAHAAEVQGLVSMAKAAGS